MYKKCDKIYNTNHQNIKYSMQNPKQPACFDLSLDTVPMSKAGVTDLLGRELYHGDLIRFKNTNKCVVYAYVVDEHDELLVNRGIEISVPWQVSLNMPDAIGYYKHFEWESIMLSRNDVHVSSIFKEPHDIFDNGTFEAYKTGKNLIDCANDCVYPTKFFMSIKYKGCFGVFAYSLTSKISRRISRTSSRKKKMRN